MVKFEYEILPFFEILKVIDRLQIKINYCDVFESTIVSATYLRSTAFEKPHNCNEIGEKKESSQRRTEKF